MSLVLVVEDKESMAQMLSETMKVAGYRVLLAKDGREAIHCLKEQKVDLVLTDDTILTTVVFEACNSITVGPNFAIMGQGDVTFRAGAKVVFREVFFVGPRAVFRVEIGPLNP